MRILISGASVAGPVLAYWLNRHGFDVTVVERAPALRKTGGHAVDLFRPAMEMSEKMGVLPQIEALATGTDRLTLYREGVARPVRVDLTKVVGGISDRHVEIMRDDLSEVYRRLGSQLGTKKEPRQITAGFAGLGLVLLGLGAAMSLRWSGRLV